MEQKIISAALYSRGAYNTLYKHGVVMALSDVGKILWESIEKYYDTDESAQSVDKEILCAKISMEYPKHEEMLNSAISQMEPVSTDNLLALLIDQKLETNKLLLSQAFSSGKTSDIEPLLDEYHSLMSGQVDAEEESNVLIAPDIEAMMESRSEENRITLLPPQLNAAMDGGALQGHHIVIFGVTDMGKTLFILNMIRGWIEQGKRVLYCGNEDPVSDLIERFLVGLLNRDKFLIRKHWKKAQEAALKRGWDNLIWAELSPGSLRDIRGLVERHKPDILVVDKIRNLHTGDKNFVRVLEVAAQGMRNIAKKYNILTVSLTQAGDSANGKTILTRGDIDSSNVGIPGTADLMLGIGATAEEEGRGVRTLSFPKNKISGNKRPIKCFFNTKTMRVE